MKYFIILLSLFGLSASAQESKSFMISGRIKTPIAFDLTSFDAYEKVSLDSLVIYNHLMQRKSRIDHVKGVALKALLAKAEIDSPSPTLLSEYYLVCTASDGYRVVLSWNDVFNSKTASNFLILTNFDAVPAKAEKGNIAMIAPGDEASGRRFVKG